MKFWDKLIAGITLSFSALIFGGFTVLVFDYITGYETSEFATTIVILCWVAILFTKFDVNGSKEKGKYDEPKGYGDVGE
jgi:uncharacterized membrane protein YqjE